MRQKNPGTFSIGSEEISHFFGFLPQVKYFSLTNRGFEVRLLLPLFSGKVLILPKRAVCFVTVKISGTDAL